MSDNIRDILNTDKVAPDGYFRALGQFVSFFTVVESYVHFLLAAESGVSQKMAKAVFSGVRVDQAKTLIKRAREVNGAAPSELLERTFAQLTVVSTVRNDILHHGPNTYLQGEEGFEATVSNHRRAMPGREHSFPISVEILEDLTEDAITILAALAHLLIEKRGLDDFADISRASKRHGSRPWRYKSPPQAHSRQQRPKGAPEQPSPPESSQG